MVSLLNSGSSVSGFRAQASVTVLCSLIITDPPKSLLPCFLSLQYIDNCSHVPKHKCGIEFNRGCNAEREKRVLGGSIIIMDNYFRFTALLDLLGILQAASVLSAVSAALQYSQ